MAIRDGKVLTMLAEKLLFHDQCYEIGVHERKSNAWTEKS